MATVISFNLVPKTPSRAANMKNEKEQEDMDAQRYNQIDFGRSTFSVRWGPRFHVARIYFGLPVGSVAKPTLVTFACCNTSSTLTMF